MATHSEEFACNCVGKASAKGGEPNPVILVHDQAPYCELFENVALSRAIYGDVVRNTVQQSKAEDEGISLLFFQGQTDAIRHGKLIIV